jgi:hypothetical protein
MFEQAELCLLYEALKMYRDQFSVYLQGLRQTEFQFAAANIAMARIEVLLRKIDDSIVKDSS